MDPIIIFVVCLIIFVISGLGLGLGFYFKSKTTPVTKETKSKIKTPIVTPVNGGWSSWTNGNCSVSCGTVTLTETRSCNNPVPSGNGSNCSGSSTENIPCNTQKCVAVNGGWSSWKSSACSVSCGTGTSTETRTCNNPTPEYSGSNCSGSETETIKCNTQKCVAIDGGWSAWTTTNPCNILCGTGTITESRTCNNPTPEYSGKQCKNGKKDASTETRSITCVKSNKCPLLINNNQKGPMNIVSKENINLCLSMANIGNKTGNYYNVAECNPTDPNQVFTTQESTNGKHSLQANNLWLNYHNTYTPIGVDANINNTTFSKNNSWYTKTNGMIMNEANSECLDISSSSGLGSCNSKSNTQEFYTESVPPITEFSTNTQPFVIASETAPFVIQSQVNNNLCLNTTEFGKANSQGYYGMSPCDATDRNQLFYSRYQSSTGQQNLLHQKSSDDYLAVSATNSGLNVGTTAGGSPNAEWYSVYGNNGLLQNYSTKTCLDISQPTNLGTCNQNINTQKLYALHVNQLQ
jgi:hypothetical protein